MYNAFDSNQIAPPLNTDREAKTCVAFVSRYIGWFVIGLFRTNQHKGLCAVV
jgi:hypothetical protein